MTDPEPTRRRFLLPPLEGLLLPRGDEETSALTKRADRLEEFITTTSISSRSVYASPLLSVPVPVYPTIAPGHRRWEETRPTAMWSPLMWLPQRLSHPYLLTGADEAGRHVERLESPDEMMVRLALELTASGIYDPKAGGWIDVLALHGIDVSDSDQVARVRAWLAGGGDPALDRIDLSEMVDSPDDTDWAVHLTQELIEDLIAASWHLVATDLLDVLAALHEEAPSAEAIVAALEGVAAVARSDAGEAIVDLDLDIQTRMGQILAGLSDAGSSTAALMDGPVAEAEEALSVVAGVYRDAAETLDSLGADLATE